MGGLFLYARRSNLCRDFGLFQFNLIFLTLSQGIQFDDLVTSARPRFQARSVEDSELASDVTDQVPLLEGAGRISNALAAHAQHVGEELLGELEFVRPETVMRHEQPAGEARLQRVETITGGRLGNLCQ